MVEIITIVISCNIIAQPFPLSTSYSNKSFETNLDSSKIYNNFSVDTAKTLKEKYFIDQIDNTNGLSNSSVNTIFQDSENLLWIGTWDGLNRYDGEKFKIFRPKLDAEDGLSNQVILKINEDNAGQIWVLTMNGINSYNKRSNTFKNYHFLKKNNFTLSEAEFNFALNNSKKVFCGVKDWGIGYFDGNEFQKIENTKLPVKAVKKMKFAPSGELLILFENNELYSLKLKQFETHKKTFSDIKMISDNIRSFGVLQNHKICLISTSGNVILYSLSGEFSKKVIKKNAQKIIGCTHQGIVISDENGYFLVNNLGEKINQKWLENLKNQKITALVQGSENIIWTGTDGDGILKLYPRRKYFNLVSKKQIPAFDGGIVRAFLKVDEKSFFVGTKGKGLFRFSSSFYLKSEKPLKYENFNSNNSLINNAVFSLYKGKDGMVFIGTDGEGLNVYDLKNSKFINWSEMLGNELCDYFKSTYAIFQDNNGFIWLGTNGYGMIRFKIDRIGEKLKISHFRMYQAGNEGKNALSSNIIFSIIPKNEDELWLGTRLGGLNLFNKKTELFKVYKNEVNNPNSLSSNDILCLHTDINNRLWVGTSFGLNLLQYVNKKNAMFRRFTVNEGLPNNTIHGIVSDSLSNLWLSTNFGLSHLIVDEFKFINFTKNEGLQNNEFADGAYYQDPTSGLIFMGGIKGFNYFSPSKIKESTVLPDLFIDKISGQNQEFPYYQGLVVSPNSTTFPSMVLDHNQNFFNIELAILTFINSEKCQYAYKLDNFDQEWNEINNRRIISFTNVPKGAYSLWVKWSNSDGIWSKPVHAIDIRIKPVFWQSNTAFFVYIILIGLFILFVASYYQKKKSLRQTIINRKKDAETHQNRLTFFTNIAHELQTPLTLIVGPAQKLSESINMNEKNSRFIKMIQRNSSRLLFLTQQLLEFRKAEYDYLEVMVKQFDLVNLLEQIAELFDELAIQNNIDYKVEIPTELIGWFDKDKIEKIIFNLLSNAFKYTPKNGKIKLEISINGTPTRTLNIKVANSGKGIPKDKLDSLFDRFFLSENVTNEDNSLFRTGIGLAYVNKMVKIMRGEIIVKSNKNKNTVFNVFIPCDKEVFDERELDKENKPVYISKHLHNILENTIESVEITSNKISSLESVLDTKKIVLIVEDESDIRILIKELLKEEYTVLMAANGVEALDIINKKEPDIIISDIMMPEMDGIELCNIVKGDYKTCHIPFIMLTAKNSVIHRVEGLASGANSYIPKPFYPEHLIVRVHTLLKEKELLRNHFLEDSFVENLTSLSLETKDKDFIQNVIELIQSNIENENLQSLLLEKELGMSNSNLYRKIKELFGFSPGDLIRTVRLKHAAELLKKSTLTVSEICYKSGFNNRSYFYREFKKMYNITPKNYQIKFKPKG